MMKHVLAALLLAAPLSGCDGKEGGGDALAAPAGADNQMPLAAAPETSGAAQATKPASKPAKGNPRGLPDGALRVEPAVILDHNGFEAPMAAATLFIPQGWKTEGGVEWGQQHMCTNGYSFNWRASSPDGLTMIAVLPQEVWAANNYGAPATTPGCQLAPYRNVREHLEARMQRVRPGARVTDFRRRPDLEKDLAALNSTTPMPLGETRTWVEGGELSFSYSEGGREMRGSIAEIAVFNLMRTDAGYGTGVMEGMTGSTFPAYGAVGPAGEFDPAFAEAIRRSIKVNPEWEARINKHNNAIAQNALEEGRKRSAIISKTNSEIAQIRQDAWNAQQESSDRRAREFGEVIREVETYNDADAPGGTVELSHHYDQAWKLNDGTYVLTNDASFEPYRDLGVDGNKLEAAK